MTLISVFLAHLSKCVDTAAGYLHLIWKFYLWKQITLLCWENTRLLCVCMHAFGTRWLTCSNKRNEMWRTRTCSQSGRLQVFRTSWCLELLHSKLFPASSKTIVTEIDAQQSANLIRLPGNLQAPALKPVTILLHGLIEWKISFQSSPHPRVAPHHSSSAL